MSYRKQMLISVGLVVVGFALIKWEDFENRKRTAKNDEIMKQNAEANEAFEKNISNINNDLDRRIEAGKFWLIVTQNED